MGQDQLLHIITILLPYLEEQAVTSIHKSAILGDPPGTPSPVIPSVSSPVIACPGRQVSGDPGFAYPIAPPAA
jgi:hypothetical protein